MKTRIYALLTALLASIGLVFVTAAPASADTDGHWERIVNSSALTITGGFLSGGQFVTLNISSGGWQGEGNGNMSYEPRNLHVKSQWCMNWHYLNRYNDGTTATTATTTECAPSNVYPIGTVKIFNVFKSATYDYDIVVTRYWGP